MRFLLLLTIAFTIGMSFVVYKTKASNQGYFPPRIQQLCNDNFIGTDWNKSMKYEKRCRVLWAAWTNEIKHEGVSR